MDRFRSLILITAAALSIVIAGAAAALAATIIHAGGCGPYLGGPSNIPASACWSVTDVQNPAWAHITNATFTGQAQSLTASHDAVTQVYSLTEKQKAPGDPVSVTGQVTLRDDVTGQVLTETIAPLVIAPQPGGEVPFTSDASGNVVVSFGPGNVLEPLIRELAGAEQAPGPGVFYGFFAFSLIRPA